MANFFLICFLFISRKGSFLYYIFDLQKLEDVASKYLLSFLVFSLAGIPPLAGFFSKILVFSIFTTSAIKFCDLFYWLF